MHICAYHQACSRLSDWAKHIECILDCVCYGCDCVFVYVLCMSVCTVHCLRASQVNERDKTTQYEWVWSTITNILSGNAYISQHCREKREKNYKNIIYLSHSLALTSLLVCVFVFISRTHHTFAATASCAAAAAAVWGLCETKSATHWLCVCFVVYITTDWYTSQETQLADSLNWNAETIGTERLNEFIK